MLPEKLETAPVLLSSRHPTSLEVFALLSAPGVPQCRSHCGTRLSREFCSYRTIPASQGKPHQIFKNSHGREV